MKDPSGVVAGPLADALCGLAAAPRLVVASDFDGTLAPIADKPWLVTPDPVAVRGLVALAALPGTDVAVVSARTLSDLAQHLGAAPGVRLLGSYGAETAAGPLGLTEAEARRWTQVAVAFERLAVAHPLAWVERKALGVAFHGRGVPDAAALLDEAAEAAAGVRDVHIVRGTMVVEAVVRPVSKAAAVNALTRHCAADAVLYLGDDRADEDVFEALAPPDLGVHVGAGPTAAAFTVADPAQVGHVLTALCDLRRARRNTIMGPANPAAPVPSPEELHHAR